MSYLDLPEVDYVFVNLKGELIVEWFPLGHYEEGDIVDIQEYHRGKYMGTKDVLECLGEL